MAGAMSARVLIVDDSPAFRAAARAMLVHRGYRVVGEASDGAAAVALAARLLPDAVLLDVHLGTDDGFAVARAVTGACPGAAVLLTSCEEQPADEVTASGARGFVLKSELAAAVMAAFWPVAG
jgi:DNA-binding NarL/FixJ family response regulator